MVVDKNDIAYWFPKLLLSEQPVPKTIIIQTDDELWEILDGETPAQSSEFIAELKHAISIIGDPVFLRTGHTSGKHNAKDTCFLESPIMLPSHIYALVEESGMAMPSLPIRTWAIREMLLFGNPAAFTAFNGLPIRKERRYFFRDGKVEHHIPYWPEEVFGPKYYGDQLPEYWESLLRRVNQESGTEIKELTNRTESVAKYFEGWWSLDWIFTMRGWVAIDMARGEDSWGRDYQTSQGE